MFLEVVAGVIVGMYIYNQLQKPNGWINSFLGKSLSTFFVILVLLTILAIGLCVIYAFSFILSLNKNGDPWAIFKGIIMALGAFTSFAFFDSLILTTAEKYKKLNSSRSLTVKSSLILAFIIFFTFVGFAVLASVSSFENQKFSKLLSTIIMVTNLIVTISSYTFFRVGKYPDFINKWNMLEKENISPVDKLEKPRTEESF